jgi:hypothetical protein
MIYKKDMPVLYSYPASRLETYPKLPDEYHHSGWNVKYFDVPTEFVARTTQIFTPIQGRYWEVNLYCYLDEVYLPQEELVTKPMYKGYIFKHTQAYVIERWEDHGDDGHTKYRFSGYAIVPSVNEAARYHKFQVEDSLASYEHETWLAQINHEK